MLLYHYRNDSKQRLRYGFDQSHHRLPSFVQLDQREAESTCNVTQHRPLRPEIAVGDDPPDVVRSVTSAGG